MCVPAGVAAAIALAGTAVTAYGQIKAGNAAAQQAQYQASVDRNNAVIAERQAADALERGRVEERQKRIAIERAKGEQRNAFAANNVALDSGSPLDVLEFTEGQGALEQLIIRNNAEREAASFRNQAANFGASAELSLLRGSSERSAGLLSGASTLLGGAARFGSRKK